MIPSPSRTKRARNFRIQLIHSEHSVKPFLKVNLELQEKSSMLEYKR